ncbi:MAG: response regulator, partial [Polyangiaceae bacterium]|nr:response regulator [Polyangiaceae bacterium]
MSEHEDREFPLGAARAGFVASVRRKATAMRALLPEVSQTPKRDELRRKLHALGSGARSLHLDALERAVSDMMGRLDRTPREGVLVAADVEVLERTLAELPALAWGREDVRVTAERAIVAFGEPQFLGDLGPNVDCERTLDRAVALARARELSIDALVIDADSDGAFELCADLLDDEVTQDLTVIVVGAFGMPGDDARFIALGARFVVNKPLDRIGLKELLDEALAPPIAVSPFGAELGTPSLEELSTRLGEELRRGLLAVGRAADREKSVPLGEGVEVYAALWGAIARIREVVAAKTKGELTFTDPGPYGAVAMAPSLELDTERSMRNRSTRRGMGSEDVPLAGRRILVVDDDPGVTWFMADLLRSQGCLVDEALDGEQGLLRAYAAAPELVISDILMPKLDGPSLCRALGRDVVLQHTPVVLLSWKEDLMQRVRELGSSASAFLRKESDVRAVVARVQEVLRPRARLEARFVAGGPVRGRLDGFTVSAFVDMVLRFRGDVCISIRDAAFLYELEIRGGAPRSAVRSSGDGTVLSGMNAFRALLGVSSGRFSVEDRNSAIEDELQGSFRELSMVIVSERRAVIHALSEDRLVEAAAMDVHDERLRDVLRGMPARTGVIAGRILAGASPRELLLRDRIDPSELLDVLLHLARRGAILSVRTAEGHELSVPITLPHFDLAEETRLSRRPPPVAADSSETPDPDGMAVL